MLNNAISNFCYDGTLEGFLSVMNYAIESKTMPTHICSEYLISGTINENKYIKISTDYKSADRLYRLIGRHSSPEVQQMLNDCFLTCLPDMEMDLFIMVCKAIKYGAVIAEDYSDTLMRRIQFAIRDLYREAQSTFNAINSVKIDNVTFSIINPRNNVLPVIGSSILKKEEYDDLLIYDKRHGIALLRIGDNATVLDLKRILISEINSVSDLRNKVWKYFTTTGNVPNRDVRSMRAESLSRLWYIAS